MYSFHTFQKYLAQIFTKTFFHGGHFEQNARWRPYRSRSKCKHCFLIAYVISFPKMYRFHTLQKIPTKLHSELDYQHRAYFNSLNGGTNVPPLYGFVPPLKCVPPPTLCGGLSLNQ